MSVKHLLITIDESKADYSGGIPLEAPAIEVVRCGDCRHYDGDECLRLYGAYPIATDFCSRGKRHESE